MSEVLPEASEFVNVVEPNTREVLLKISGCINIITSVKGYSRCVIIMVSTNAFC